MTAMGEIRADNDALRARLRGALAVLEREAGELGIGRDRLAMFGFCFGGACALELARDGADLRAFVSFHGLLDTPAPAAGPVKGSVLVLNGADDPMVSEDSLKAFKEEMDGAGADWQLTHFGGAVHSFTDPGRISRAVRSTTPRSPGARSRPWTTCSTRCSAPEAVVRPRCRIQGEGYRGWRGAGSFILYPASCIGSCR